MIAALRGDPGYLGGFQFGTPLASSRTVQPQMPNDGGWHYRRQHGHGDGPVVINNTGPLAVTMGNGNVVQQSTSNGSGPIAQQQIAAMPGGITVGAANLATTPAGGRSTP